MKVAREIVETAHAARKEEGIRVRQPLAKLVYTAPQPLSEELKHVVLQEINVKMLEGTSGDTISVKLDTTLTPELEAEGQARDLIRDIQDARKKAGLTQEQAVDVTLPAWPAEFESEIKQKTNAVALKKGSTVRVTLKT